VQNIDLKSVNKVHCVGIGGIGVSALARAFLHRGAEVSGSDAASSLITEGLESLGIKVFAGHDKENVVDEVGLVIHTIAVPADNPELLAAKEKGISVLTYPQALGLLSKDMYTVAVSGTHGKTTTTAMLAEVLAAANKSPTVIVGSLLRESNSNFVAGDSNILVVEACEYRRSFLQIQPDILVITNIDADHLDYFEDLTDIQDAFKEMAEKVPEDGFIICNPKDPRVAPAIKSVSASVSDYTDVSLDGRLTVHGQHNRQNGQAAIAAAEKLGVDPVAASASVREFAGTWRRAELKGELESGALVYDDYGHHPTEIESTLAGFKERFPERRLVIVFQPHLYSRTKKLLDEFAGSFSQADRVILLPIYAARELPDPDISSDILLEKLKEQGVDAELAGDFNDAVVKLQSDTDEAALILTQGAGDVYKVADALIEGEK
jgi:UDP-N-acetylmuramate--alanine ligase